MYNIDSVITKTQVTQLLKSAYEEVSLIQGEGFVISESKFDYFFGRVSSNPHNRARSLSNLQGLGKLGINQELAGQEKLLGLFKDGLNAPPIRQILSPYGITLIKRLEVIGNHDQGAIEISYFYPNGNLEGMPEVVSLIPKIYKRQDL